MLCEITRKGSRKEIMVLFISAKSKKLLRKDSKMDQHLGLLLYKMAGEGLTKTSTLKSLSAILLRFANATRP